MTNETCNHCHAQLGPDDLACPSCGAATDLVDIDRTIRRPARQPPPTPPDVRPGLISSVPGPIPGSEIVEPPRLPQFEAPAASQPVETVAPSTEVPRHAEAWVSRNPVPTPPSEPPRSRNSGLGLKLAAVLAVLVVGFVGWKLVTGGDDGSVLSSTPVTSSAQPAAQPQPTAPETVAPTTALEATVPSTAAPTTEPPATAPPTVPVTEPPVTVPTPQPWSAPEIPNPPVYAGAGLAYPVSDPLLGGLPSDVPTPYLLFAQSIFDQVAAGNWDAVSGVFFIQGIDMDVPVTPATQPEWAAADRLSVLMIDAAPAVGRPGFDLVVSVVANLPDSTTVLCGRLHSDPDGFRELVQLGPFVILTQGDPPYPAEAVLRDPAQVVQLQTSCL